MSASKTKESRLFMDALHRALEALDLDPVERIRETGSGHFLVTGPEGGTAMVPSTFGANGFQEYQRRCKNIGVQVDMTRGSRKGSGRKR